MLVKCLELTVSSGHCEREGTKTLTRVISFVIEGLAGRDEPVRHTLNEDVNLFWGANGSGKTSMLKILHSALSNDIEILRSVAFEFARVEFFSDDEQRVYTRTITAEKVNKTEPVQQRIWDSEEERYLVYRNTKASRPSWATTPKTKSSNLRFQHGWLPITRITDNKLTGRRARPANPARTLRESDIDDLFSDGIEGRWQQWFNASNEEIKNAQEIALTEVLEVALRGVSKRDQSVEPLPTRQAFEVVSGFFGERNPNVRFKFRNFEEFSSRYSEDILLRDIVQRLQQVELKIAKIVEPQRRLEGLIKLLFSEKREVAFSADGITVMVKEAHIPVGALSSGERQLMLILLECLRGKSSTVIVDEPELSMHVAWQNCLVESMRTVNPRAQLIMATHSPEVMAELEDRCVIEL